MLDAFVAAEGEPESLQLSGGEPRSTRDPGMARRRASAGIRW